MVTLQTREGPHPSQVFMVPRPRRSYAPVCRTVWLAALVLLVLGFSGCSGGSNDSPSPQPPGGGTSGGTVDVVTFHNDNARTGLNAKETVLTPANVKSSTFGKLGVLQVDGKVDAQPLVVSGLSIGGKNRTVVFVETEHGSAYAFDGDSLAQLWKVSAIPAGETPSDSRSCGQITPEIGITDTPAIDRQRSPNGAIYFVAMSKDASGNYHQRLHALDLTTGAELSNSPREVEAQVAGTGAGSSGGNVVFDPKRYAERAGMLLLNGKIYTGWTSHCDIQPYTGWVIAYDAASLSQSAVLNLTPNGSEGSIWMSGGGIAADSSGNIYFLDANGTFDATLDNNGFPARGDFGNAFLKISTSGGLNVADYFTPYNTGAQSAADVDLGSGGALLLPDLQDGSGNTRHLALGGGKMKDIYVVDRDAMGKFNPTKNNIYEELSNAVSGAIYSTPAYFNQMVYVGAVGDHLKGFAVSNARLPQTATTQTSTRFVYPGTTPSISSNETSNGIVWAAENGSSAVLHAYDATDLSKELYNSQQAGSRDAFGSGNKFITPTVANGKVFVGTTNGVGVFGLLQ
jgi:hypothetical protein